MPYIVCSLQAQILSGLTVAQGDRAGGQHRTDEQRQGCRLLHAEAHHIELSKISAWYISAVISKFLRALSYG